MRQGRGRSPGGIEMTRRALLAALAITAFSFWGCATVPEPAHKVVSRIDGYEIREYSGYLVAETTVSGPWKDALNEGFRRLFSYISGNNEGSAKVAMTAPVLSREPEKIAMTAPVLQEAGTGDVQVVSFVAPAFYTMETIPAPKDPRVRIRQVPPFTAAVLRYGGWTDPEKIEKKTGELRSLLARDGRIAIPPFLSAQYNPPWTIPPFRRNEIIVRIR
jgi:DNA gyrase inhibitor GyrI